MESSVSTDRAFTGFSADGYLRHQKSETEGQGKYEIDNEKQPAAVLGSEVRKAPKVTESDGTSGS